LLTLSQSREESVKVGKVLAFFLKNKNKTKQTPLPTHTQNKNKKKHSERMLFACIKEVLRNTSIIFSHIK